MENLSSVFVLYQNYGTSNLKHFNNICMSVYTISIDNWKVQLIVWSGAGIFPLDWVWCFIFHYIASFQSLLACDRWKKGAIK